MGTYLPPTPPAATGPSSWWLVLLLVGAGGAVVALLVACILLWIAGDMDSPGGTRLWAIFCCLVPGLLMGAAAVLGGTRYFGRRR